MDTSCAYDDDKMIFDFDDSKIAKGKIGVWARDDSQAQFDDIKITVMRRRRERTGPGAGCIAVAVVSTKLPGARDVLHAGAWHLSLNVDGNDTGKSAG